MTIQLIATLPGGYQYRTKDFPLFDGKQWDMFDPVFGVGPAHPDIHARILGVHLFTKPIADDLYVCAARLSNGAANPEGTGHRGKTYFDELRLRAPGWSIAFDTLRPGMADAGGIAGPDARLVAKPAVGSNVFPSGASFVRRFALYRGKVTAEQAREWLDKCTERELAIDAKARRLPTVPNQEPRMAVELAGLRAILATGKMGVTLEHDIRTDAMGPFQPPGSSLPYEHGGQGIFFVYSWERCRSGALYWRTIADLFMERQRCVFDIQNGARITPEMWAKGAGLPYQPFSIFLTGDEEQKNTEGRHEDLPPAFDREVAFNPGNTCPYEAALANYDGVDGAHLVRALGPAYAAAAQFNDPVCTDFVLDLANWCRMGWCDIGLPPGPYRSGLPTMRSWGGAKGGQGRPSIGREGGWVATAFAFALRLVPEGPELAGLDRNARALLSMALFAALPSGLTQRASVGEVDSAWDPKSSGGYAVPKDRDITQSFEFDIAAHGLLDLMDACGLPMPPRLFQRNALLSVLAKGAKALHDNAAFPNGQPKYVTVAKAGQPALQSISEGFGHDDTHASAIKARLYRATKDKRWLQLLPSKASLQAAVAAHESWNAPEWAIEALAELENVT